MQIQPLLITIIILLAGFLGYELWKDGRLPFLPPPQATPSAQAATAEGAAASAAATAEPAARPAAPRTLVFQCEGDRDTTSPLGDRGHAPDGAHYFTLRLQRNGNAEATGMSGSTPVDRGRWEGQFREGRFTWTSERSRETLGRPYSSTIYGTLNVETGRYTAELRWAPMGVMYLQHYYGYCRAAGAQ